MDSGLLRIFVFRFHAALILLKISGLLFWSAWYSLSPSDPAERVIWWECGILHGVPRAGKAGGEVVAARLRILLRECGVVLRGEGLCACVK